MKAFCLCLDKRVDHWVELRKQVNDAGLKFEEFVVGDGTTLPLEGYDYVDDPNPDISKWGYGKPQHKKNHYNAFMAHQEIVRRAKEQGLNQFLMLEDDAYLTYRFNEVYEFLDNKYVFDGDRFDLLYLGWWIGDENDKWNVSVEENYKNYGIIEACKAKQIGGLHGVIINESMYDTILSLKPTNPIDWQLNRMHDLLASYFIIPKAIHIKSMWSFCENSFIHRKKI